MMFIYCALMLSVGGLFDATCLFLVGFVDCLQFNCCLQVSLGLLIAYILFDFCCGCVLYVVGLRI